MAERWADGAAPGRGVDRAHDEARQRGIAHAVEDLIDEGAFAKFNVGPERIIQLVSYLYNVDIELFAHKGEDHEPHHGHGAASNLFDTWSYESDQPFSLEALREMVRKELPASVYRCKGIVFVADSPDKRIALQIVGRRTEISELDEWGDRTPRTQIVAIGAPINAQELSNQFDACINHD